MNKYTVELVFRGIDPRIQEKLKKLAEDNVLGEYIENIILAHEIELHENKLRQEYDSEIRSINRKVSRLEERIIALENRKFVDSAEEEIEDKSEDGDVEEFEDDALNFINNLMSI